jgi:quercetin dioxygenase-like cupin family protein
MPPGSRALLTVVALASAVPALCQDLVAVAPAQAKVEYEDARVRVVRLRVPPGGSIPRHDRPARVVVSLTPNDVRTSLADGTTRLVRTSAGDVAWSEPARRSVTNLAAVPLENVIVELKAALEPARPRSGPPAPPPTTYLDDPRHRWAFENQYVRVYDVRIPPGETTTFHRHAYDSVAVFVSGGRVATQVEGAPWGRPESIEAGGAAFAADANTPLTHRVRNEGTSDYRVILVQLLH